MLTAVEIASNPEEHLAAEPELHLAAEPELHLAAEPELHLAVGPERHAGKAWSERRVEERTYMIAIHRELDAEDGDLLSRRIVDLARAGTRWLVLSCPESMRYTAEGSPRRTRPW